MEKWVEIILSILSGLVVVIPVVIKLVQALQVAAKERNWDKILVMVMEYMKSAEGMFKDGASKKQWTMAMVQTSAKNIDYPLTDAELAKISAMIDSMCDMAHIVNAPEKPKEPTAA